MVDIDHVDWNDRVHFFSVSSQLMRRILVDAARARAADKRGGLLRRSAIDNLDEIVSPSSERSAELIALDDALSRPSQMDPRRARNVELRIFGGLTVEESAEILCLSPHTVMRDWKFSNSWLLRELSRDQRTQ